MSLDDAVWEKLAPLIDRIRALERDAVNMQTVVGQLALGEHAGTDELDQIELEHLIDSVRCERLKGDSESLETLEKKLRRRHERAPRFVADKEPHSCPEPQFTDKQLQALHEYVFECGAHSSGERRRVLHEIKGRLVELLMAPKP